MVGMGRKILQKLRRSKYGAWNSPEVRVRHLAKSTSRAIIFSVTHDY